MKYKISKKMSWQEIDHIFYVVDETVDELYALNEIGEYIWKAISSGIHIKDMIQTIANKYEVEQKIVENDVEELLNTFLLLNFIERESE